MPSVHPPTKQKFSREANRRGGGLVLECQYVLVPGPGVVRSEIVSTIQQTIDEVEANETVH